MHLTVTTLLSIPLVLFTIGLQTRAAGVTAYSGDTCNGDQGIELPCDNSCIALTSPQRHSVQVNVTGPHCLTLFQGTTSCSTNIGQLLNPGSGACTTLNTGITVGSFKCSPSATCST